MVWWKSRVWVCALKMHKNIYIICKTFPINWKFIYASFFTEYCIITRKNLLKWVFFLFSFSPSLSLIYATAGKKGESHCLLNAYSYLLLNDLLKNHIFCVLCVIVYIYFSILCILSLVRLFFIIAILSFFHFSANAFYTMVCR